MAKSTTITANKDGEFWIDLEVAGEKKKVKIDSGYNGTIVVTKDNWNKIKDKLKEKGKSGEAETASGEKLTPEHGKGKVKVPSPDLEVEKIIEFAGTKRDLCGTEFIDNLPVTITWSHKTMTFTVDEKQKDELKKKSDELFRQEMEQNKAFYEGAKHLLPLQYPNKYVVIGGGEVKSAFDSYDEAIERSVELELVFRSVLVFRTGETPYFGSTVTEIERSSSSPDF